MNHTNDTLSEVSVIIRQIGGLAYFAEYYTLLLPYTIVTVIATIIGVVGKDSFFVGRV